MPKIGHGLGPGGRDWFLEEGEEMYLRMKKTRGRRRRKRGDSLRYDHSIVTVWYYVCAGGLRKADEMLFVYFTNAGKVVMGPMKN